MSRRKNRYASNSRVKRGKPSSLIVSPEATVEQAFVCGHCGRTVVPPEHGTKHRNHCPHCLWSRHVDRTPGDRLASCRGPMAPIAVWIRDGEWVLLHRCDRCAVIRGNRIAPDDALPALLALAARPLAQPPLPA